MQKPVKTARLVLRSAEARDADWIAAGIARTEVHRWLTAVPRPYRRADAVAWIEAGRADPMRRVIEKDGQPAGVITIGDELGYWLKPAAWGQGVMTEAAAALVDRHFHQGGGDLNSAYILGNDASARVLYRLGFADTGRDLRASSFYGAAVELQKVALSREVWAARRALPEIVTPRLRLRPLTHDDAPRLAAMAGRHEVAPMILRATIPWPLDAVHRYIDAYPWTGKLGVRLGVCHAGTGELIGMVGINNRPFTFYFFDPHHWRRGYATEAMRAFLAACYDRWDLNQIGADVFLDNPGSMRVLQKLGFELIGTRVGLSAARLEPAPQNVYRLIKSRFKAVP